MWDHKHVRVKGTKWRSAEILGIILGSIIIVLKIEDVSIIRDSDGCYQPMPKRKFFKREHINLEPCSRSST